MLFFQNVCQILWCSVNGSCRSKLDSPIDGTRCGPEKVDDASCFVLLGFRFHLAERRGLAQHSWCRALSINVSYYWCYFSALTNILSYSGVSQESVWLWVNSQRQWMEAGDTGAPGPTAPGPVEWVFSQRRGNVTTLSKNCLKLSKNLSCTIGFISYLVFYKRLQCETKPITWLIQCLTVFHRPEFGGKYCTGERKRYRTCNTKPCVKNKPTFREMLCSEFDTVPYHNELYQWIPVNNPCKWSNPKI